MLPDAADRGLRRALRPDCAAAPDVQHSSDRRRAGAVVVLGEHAVAVLLPAPARSSTSVFGPPAAPNCAQYQSTVSPSFSDTASAPTGGDLPFTLKTQPESPAAAYRAIWSTYGPNFVSWTW